MQKLWDTVVKLAVTVKIKSGDNPIVLNFKFQF